MPPKRFPFLCLISGIGLTHCPLKAETMGSIPISGTNVIVKCVKPPKVQTRYINQWRPTEATVGHKLRGVVCGSHRYCRGTTADLRKSKRSTYVVKSGQRCAAGNLLPLSFLFQIFSHKILLSGIVVRLLINYHRVCGVMVARDIWDVEATFKSYIFDHRAC